MEISIHVDRQRDVVLLIRYRVYLKTVYTLLFYASVHHKIFWEISQAGANTFDCAQNLTHYTDTKG